jgi:hypothetical protein
MVAERIACVNASRRRSTDLFGVKLCHPWHSCPLSFVVTQDMSRWDKEQLILSIPIRSFSLAF